MRRMHPPRLALVLAAAALAAAPAAAQNGVAVEARHLSSLQTRLNGFAAGLGAEERALWDGVLRRAAAAPAATAEVRVAPVLQIGPGGGCDGGGDRCADDAAGRVAIIIQGGRAATPAGIVIQGGRTPSSAPAAGPAPRGGITVQGGRTPAAAPATGPRPNPAGAVAIGPKQDDPGAPRPGSVVAIGPKQDDPAPPPQSLGRRLAAFATTLPPEERGALEWLLTRASSASSATEGTPGARPGTPGGLPPGTRVSLRQALGIDPLAIGPKQDDPAPPPPAQRWMLRY